MFIYAQRGNPVNVVGGWIYSPDRYQAINITDAVFTLGTDFTVRRSNYNSLKINITSADTSIASGQVSVIAYPIEGYDIMQLFDKTLTLDFWVRSPVTGVHGLILRSNGPASDYRRLPLAYTVNAINTWERKTITFKMDSYSATYWTINNGLGMRIQWALASGSSFNSGTVGTWTTSAGDYVCSSAGCANVLNATGAFYIAEPQLYIGSRQQPFIPKYTNIADEYPALRRYTQFCFAGAVGTAEGSTIFAFSVPLIPVMRYAPQVSRVGTCTIRCAGGDCSSTGTLANVTAQVDNVWAHLNGFTGLTSSSIVNRSQSANCLLCDADFY